MRTHRFKLPVIVALTLISLSGIQPLLPQAFANVTVQNLVNLPDLVEKVLPGVVNISTTTVIEQRFGGMDDFMNFWGIPSEYKSSSLGTGFLLDKDGYVMTNNHVIEHATEVVVTLQDKRQLEARIVGKDPKMDLALLKLRTDTGSVPPRLIPVPFGDSDTVRIAEPVFAVGNPFGLQHTVTTGIISAKNRTIGVGPFDNFLQTDASINPGNSGGPLFNFKGEVIGINTMIFSKTGQSGGLGFAIPANEAKAILGDLKKYGRVPRPWLGVRIQTVTPQLARVYQLPVREGVVIYGLVRGAPAVESGLKNGDIITQVNGTPVKETLEMERELLRQKPKSAIQLTVQRGPRALKMQVQLEELPRQIDELPQGVL
jgi:serine protease Do